jgi:YhcH/YjgK/YiaL family protein
MIYDRVEHIGAYRGISANLDRAIARLEEGGLDRLELGKHQVDGEKVFLLAQSYETKEAPRGGRYEAHRKYIDIQLLTEGSESCYYESLEGLETLEPYAADRDAGFYKGSRPGEGAGSGGLELRLAPGFFAVFFPQDAHMPCCAALDDRGAPAKKAVRKIVVKVAV